MKKIALIGIMLVAVSSMIFSCKKKDGDNQGLDIKDSQNFDIMSTKKGSWWLYIATDGDTFYRYATSRDTVVEGLRFNYFYRIVINSSLKEENPEFFGKNGDKYLSLIDLDGKHKNYITYVILKENIVAGQKWTNTETKKIEGFNVDMYIESEVRSVSDILTYNGKTYDNVILVHNDLKAKLTFQPGYVKCGVLDVWFKKGVGIIREKGDIDISPAGVSLVSKQYEDYLMDYYIEP